MNTTYKIMNQKINVNVPTQWNYGQRSIEITKQDGTDPIYSTITLNPEQDSWQSQLPAEISVYVRPSQPNPIFFNLPKTSWPGTYSSNSSQKEQAMKEALDEMSDQAAEWVERFVYTKTPECR